MEFFYVATDAKNLTYCLGVYELADLMSDELATTYTELSQLMERFVMLGRLRVRQSGVAFIHVFDDAGSGHLSENQGP